MPNTENDKKILYEGGPFLLPELLLVGHIHSSPFAGGEKRWKDNILAYIKLDPSLSEQKRKEYTETFSLVDDTKLTFLNELLKLVAPNVLGPWEGTLSTLKTYSGYYPKDNPIYRPLGDKYGEGPINPDDTWDYNRTDIITWHKPAFFHMPSFIYKILDNDIDYQKMILESIKKAKQQVDSLRNNPPIEEGWFAKTLYKKGGIMKKLIPKHQTGKKIKNPTLTNTDGKPLGQGDVGTAYAYSDKEGYTGELYDYDSGMQTLRKTKPVTDRNGNNYYREVRQLFWPSGHLESDTTYIYRLPNGREVVVQKGSKLYDWLQLHTHDSKGLGYWWDKFISLFGYKYGGKLIPKCLDGGQINQNESSNANIYEGNISRKEYINKYVLSYLDFIFGKSDRYLEPDGALPGYEIQDGLILDKHGNKDLEFIKFPEYIYDQGLKVDSLWDPKKLQTI